MLCVKLISLNRLQGIVFAEDKYWLFHWGGVTHTWVSKWIIIGSDNGLSPGRRQAIIWTKAGILSIRTSGTNFSEILTEIHTFSFKKMQLKMSSAKCLTFCLGLNVLTAPKRKCRHGLIVSSSYIHNYSYYTLINMNSPKPELSQNLGHNDTFLFSEIVAFQTCRCAFGLIKMVPW